MAGLHGAALVIGSLRLWAGGLMAAAGAAPKIGLRTELASDFVGIRVPVAAGRCLAGVDKCVPVGASSSAVQVGKPISVLRNSLGRGLVRLGKNKGATGRIALGFNGSA